MRWIKKMSKQLEDYDYMPFGKYAKGKPDACTLENVPASYFHWLWVNGKNNQTACPIHDYIKRSMSALKQEHPDGIWS